MIHFQSLIKKSFVHTRCADIDIYLDSLVMDTVKLDDSMPGGGGWLLPRSCGSVVSTGFLEFDSSGG